MCTRIFWSKNQVAKVVSRTMDWSVSDEPMLFSVPAGLTRGGAAGTAGWQSQYRSVGLSMFGSGTVDGMNEKGLAAHLLYLDGAGYADRGTPDALPNTLWAQYVLDNFATVGEAVAALERRPVISIPVRGNDLGAHLAIEDVLGDSAILEPVDGTITVHHGRQFRVMANAPGYEEQLESLGHYLPFGGERPLPGGIASLDRFVRANYFLHYLPEPTNSQEAVARILQLATNVAVPAGAPYDDGGVYPTWWIAAADLTNLTYYHWSLTNPSLTWINLQDIHSAGTAGVDVQSPGLQGDLQPSLHPLQLSY